jgi:FtsP/CotA-like multicopper oxidase with cupredoxin domain
MEPPQLSRRKFLAETGALVGASVSAPILVDNLRLSGRMVQEPSPGPADYTLRIKASPIEIAPKRIISTTAYNGQFPGPLVRLKEGRPVTVEIHNDTPTPEQLHWHGQKVPVDVDGSAEEGTPFIPAHGIRRITFTPGPAGLRLYHTHNRAGADLAAGQYGGQVGVVYIEPAHDPGEYDREVFLVLKEFEPSLSRGGDMAQDFLAPGEPDKELKLRGESAMRASLAKGMPHGYEVGYRSFTINGRMLGHGEPVRVKQGERVLFHILNGSATEIRSLALPGHTFRVVELDGNSVARPAEVPVIWLGTAERISAMVEMNHPGVWVMGDLADDDRAHGMGIVVEYAGRSGKPQWTAPPAFKWNYLRFMNRGAVAASPDEVIEMIFAKENAAADGFNSWTINHAAYPFEGAMASPGIASFHLKPGRRYRLRMRNSSDDIHPIHLHRHSFEIASIAGRPAGGLFKDVMMLGGYQKAEVDFVADNPGMTLFHCHQQLHMDFGFMALFDYM